MEKKSTAEANIELDNEYNIEATPSGSSSGSSAAEANLQLNEQMAKGNKSPEDVIPTYLSNGTAAIIVTGDND